MDKYSYTANLDVAALDELYKAYSENPESVDYSWRKFFEGFDFSLARYGENNGAVKSDYSLSEKEIQVRNLIHAYRSRGHLRSKTNPIRPRKDRKARLELEDFRLSEADLDKVFIAGRDLGLEDPTLRKIIETLKTIYEKSIGFEYMYVRDAEIVDWFKAKCEAEYVVFKPTSDEKKRMLKKLNEAVVFENFLHTKYVGQKRFSIEGGENTIPALDTIINAGAALGVTEFVIGMAHRGRLNVLCNIMGKTYEQIFNEFEGNIDPDKVEGDGDVKYHMGYFSEIVSPEGNNVHLTLSPNPSHLEAVDPVILGYARAQIEDEYKGDFQKAVPILIHGDAAVAGQGIIYEIAQMSKLPGYTTGGTIHFVINNQVGFTTDFDDARSSIYCTDIAKLIDAPIIHVNGDDLEAVVWAAKTAIEYRQLFNRDIFIDMLCYRRHGHNESDEPKFTQPKLYNLIGQHPNPREVYTQLLKERGDADAGLAQDLDKEFREQLQNALNNVKQQPLPYKSQKLELEWQSLTKAKPDDFDKSPDTSISQDLVEKVGKALTTTPEGFKPLKQIENLIKERHKQFFETKSLNWASAELLAYGSLLTENKIVRLSGQDVKRGTFSHRHAVLMDSETNEAYINIDNITPTQEKFRVFNSFLSEFGVLGFEYGYAMATPNATVIWEAQFGDFANGAQVMIDQFISSAETKWNRMNGLIMLLPHGYEGQGPEHSSARLERFLQLAADNNLIIANVTLPANLFHLVRRQTAWNFRKPCVVMSPKSLLRHPLVMSPISDFTKGGFKEVLDDTYAKAKEVTKVLYCSGKVYYDLLAKQQEDKRSDVAIVRLEQLYPFPEKQLAAIVSKYSKAKFVWVQEEPENMGAWTFIQRLYKNSPIEVISRKASASPATGYPKVHAKQQSEIVNKSFE